MRLVVLIVGGVAAGALSGGALQTFAPGNVQMLAAVRALGGDVASIKLADINPLKAYADVKRQIASREIERSLNLRSAPALPAVSNLGNPTGRNTISVDNAQIQRGLSANISTQIRETRSPTVMRGPSR
jgi:hypothetical protein